MAPFKTVRSNVERRSDKVTEATAVLAALISALYQFSYPKGLPAQGISSSEVESGEITKLRFLSGAIAGASGGISSSCLSARKRSYISMHALEGGLRHCKHSLDLLQVCLC